VSHVSVSNKPMKYGYARVSTLDENPALQMDAFKKAKCDHIFSEKRTGADRNRPALKPCLKELKPGDRLMRDIVLGVSFHNALGKQTAPAALLKTQAAAGFTQRPSASFFRLRQGQADLDGPAARRTRRAWKGRVMRVACPSRGRPMPSPMAISLRLQAISSYANSRRISTCGPEMMKPSHLIVGQWGRSSSCPEFWLPCHALS
jgi:hypothetical protein